MNIPALLSRILVATTLLSPMAGASLVVTYAEGPDDVNSRLNSTTVFNFNGLAPGHTYENVEWTGVGTFDEIHILEADSYGGAVDPGFENGSPYSVQAAFAGVTSTTITFDSPHAYFGLWWSAGDPQNILDFYRSGTLIATFTSATLLDRLSTTDEYRGNPRNRDINRGENYAFINFFAQGGTTWDRIVLRNGPGTGFESDNYTDRERPWTFDEDGPMPGHLLTVIQTPSLTPIPETGSLMLGALGLTLLLVRHRARTS